MTKGQFLAARRSTLTGFEEVTGYHFKVKKYRMFVYRYGNGWSANEYTTGYGCTYNRFPKTRREAIAIAEHAFRKHTVAYCDKRIAEVVARRGCANC